MADYILKDIAIPNSDTGTDDVYHVDASGTTYTDRNGQVTTVEDALRTLEQQCMALQSQINALLVDQ